MEHSITEKNVDDWVDYAVSQSKALSHLNDYELESIVDNEVLNPNLQAILADDALNGFKGEESADLSLIAKSAITAGSFRFWPRMKKLKRLIRKVFCEVVGPIADEEFDLKSTIKAVLLALIPFFAGGVPALLLPVIIPIIVGFFRKGVSKVCPV